MIKRIYPVYQPTMPPAEQDVLMLGDGLHIHPDALLSNSIFGSGMPGSGKTTTFVRILEEIARFNVPLCTFDIEGDIASAVQTFPRGFIATAGNCPTAKDIIKGGLQVVFDLSTWPDMGMRAAFIARMVSGLFTHMDSLPINQRCPVLVALDEAQMWLPQRRGDLFSPETYKALNEAFHTLATRGRKRGLVPMLFCQKISEISKTVLSPGTYFLLRQSVTVDQKRYLEIIEKSDIFSILSEKQIMQYIGSLPQGKAIVKLSGEQKIVQMYERSSVHISHTPTVSSAMSRYSALSFNPNIRFGADIGEDIIEEASPKPARGTLTQVDQVRAMLEKNPNLTVCEIMKRTGFHQPSVSRIRKKFLAEQKQR
jgi:hypothetical protein